MVVTVMNDIYNKVKDVNKGDTTAYFKTLTPI